jgi:hypothetical protein
MTLKFTTTDAAGATHGVKLLVYSPSGVGKTTLCSTAPTPIILSAEAGLLSLRKFKLPVIEIKTIVDLQEAFAWCQSSKEASHFQTICLDSLTEIGEVVLANAKQLVKDPRQAYGELIEKMTMVIRAFRDLPNRNVYMSAQQEPMKDELTGVIQYGPSMPGAKLGPKLPYFFDEVFRLSIGKMTDGTLFRYLQTQPDIQYVAKDRSGSLAAMEQPDLTVVFNKIQA